MDEMKSKDNLVCVDATKLDDCERKVLQAIAQMYADKLAEVELPDYVKQVFQCEDPPREDWKNDLNKVKAWLWARDLTSLEDWDGV